MVRTAVSEDRMGAIGGPHEQEAPVEHDHRLAALFGEEQFISKPQWITDDSSALRPRRAVGLGGELP